MPQPLWCHILVTHSRADLHLPTASPSISLSWAHLWAYAQGCPWPIPILREVLDACGWGCPGAPCLSASGWIWDGPWLPGSVLHPWEPPLPPAPGICWPVQLPSTCWLFRGKNSGFALFLGPENPTQMALPGDNTLSGDVSQHCGDLELGSFWAEHQEF